MIHVLSVFKRWIHYANSILAAVFEEVSVFDVVAFGLQDIEQFVFPVTIQSGLSGQTAVNANMSQVKKTLLDTTQAQGLDHQGEDLDVTLDPGMAI